MIGSTRNLTVYAYGEPADMRNGYGPESSRRARAVCHAATTEGTRLDPLGPTRESRLR